MILTIMILSLIGYTFCWIYYGVYKNKYDRWSGEFKKRDKLTGKICDICGWVLLSTFAVALLYLVVLLVTLSKTQYSEYEVYSEKNIVALEDNTDIEGRLYYRTGYIEENLYYYYMESLSNGGKKIGKIKAEETTVFEGSDNYKVEFYKSTRKAKDYLFLGIMTMEDVQYKTYLYVPKDTVINNYNIDMK